MNNEEFLTQAELDRITAYIQQIIKLNKELLATAEAVNNLPSAPGTPNAPKSRPDAQLAAAERELNKIYAERARIMTQIDVAVKNSSAVQAAANVKAQRTQELALVRAIAKEEAAAEGSKEKISATLGRMIIQQRQLNRQTVEGRKEFDRMGAEMNELNAQLLKMETARGAWGRNVSNYAGFNALGFQVQQVARELPSLTHSLPQFFLAISNNLPMLTDEFGKATIKYKAFQKALAEGQDVEKVEKPWKQVRQSILSWQTALVVGITLLVSHGDKVIAWAKNLFTGKDAALDAAGAMKKVNDTLEVSDFGKKMANFERLKDLYAEIGDNAKAKEQFLKDYREELDETGVSVRTLIEADNLFINNSAAYIDALKLRTQANAAQGLAEKEYAKQFEAQEKANEKIRKSGAQGAFDYFNSLEKGTKVFSTDFKTTVQQNLMELQQVAFSPYLMILQQRASESGLAEDWAAYHGRRMTEMREEANMAEYLGEKFNDIYADLGAQAQNIFTDAGFTELQKPDKDPVVKTSRARLKALEDERQAMADLATSEIDDQIGVIRRTLAQNKAAINERMSMVDDLYDLEEERAQKLYEIQRENLIQRNIDENTTYKEDGSVASTIDRVQAEKNVQNQLLALEYAFNAKIVDITNERIKQINDLENKRVQDAVRSVQAHLNALNRALTEGESVDLTDLSAEYAKGLMSREQYEQKQLEISRYYAAAREQSELDAMQSRLDAMNTEPVEYRDIDEQQAIIDLEQEIADKEVEIQARKNNEIIEDNQRMHDRIAQAAKTAFNGLLEITTELVNMQTERKLAALDKQLKISQAATDEEIDRIDRLYEHGAISEEEANARKAKTEQEQKLREEQISQQRAEIQKRQARMQVLVQTAQAIMQGAASAPWPWNLIPIGFAVATGAIQLAAVNAAKYAHGTPVGGHPGGLAWVGDGGRSELITYGGKGYKSPAVPTLIDLPKGAEVLPDYNIAVRDMILASVHTPVQNWPSDVPVFDDKNMLARFDRTNERLDKLGRINEIHLAEYRREKANRRFDEFRRRPITRKIN